MTLQRYYKTLAILEDCQMRYLLNGDINRVIRLNWVYNHFKQGLVDNIAVYDNIIRIHYENTL